MHHTAPRPAPDFKPTKWQHTNTSHLPKGANASAPYWQYPNKSNSLGWRYLCDQKD